MRAGELAKQALAKNKNLSLKALAKNLLKEYPSYYNNWESWRSLLRYYAGSKGKFNRKQAQDKSLFSAQAIKKLLEEELIDEDSLPASEYDTTWGPLVLDSERNLILSDIHIPFQCQRSLELALQFGADYGPDTVILNGDVVDHYNLSEFLKDPKAKDFQHERKCTLQFLAFLRKRFPRARILWKEGNHEYWYFKHMMKHNGALMGIKYFHIESVYRLEEFCIEYVKDNRPIELMGLWILHGHELSKNSIGVPVNPARSVYLKAATTMLVGHHHITSEHTTQNAKGQITTTWSVGCLCGLRPPYARYSKYNNGFATIDCDKKKSTFHVSNKKIHNGKII